ncbi:MAG: hypothetical protein DMF56_15680 [Acidobacteria bacterium]|nr:MAG: hypothetical protein DMF56_15680 [Acidobacteriota bacterium]
MHEVPSWINAMSIAVAAMLGLNTALLAWLLYFSSRRRRREEWLRHLIELHSLFWKGEDFSRVRSWLACPESHATLRPILRKRRAVYDDESNAEPVTDDDYALISSIVS